MHQTSGKLRYSEVKGLHLLDADWWIDTGLMGNAFRLLSYDDHAGSELGAHGRLFCRKGYLWDGSSGPTVDGEADPVPSLVHDTFYEAFRTGRLDIELRPRVDALYRDLLIERGMSKARAYMRWIGLSYTGAGWWASRRAKGPAYPKRMAA